MHGPSCTVCFDYSLLTGMVVQLQLSWPALLCLLPRRQLEAGRAWPSAPCTSAAATSAPSDPSLWEKTSAENLVIGAPGECLSSVGAKAFGQGRREGFTPKA